MAITDYKTNLFGFLYAAQFAVLDDGKISPSELEYLKSLAKKMGINWLNQQMIENIANEKKMAYGPILLSRLNPENEQLYFLYLLVQSFTIDQINNKSEQEAISRVIKELGWTNFDMSMLAQRLKDLKAKEISCGSISQQNRLHALIYLLFFSVVDGELGAKEEDFFKKQIKLSTIDNLTKDHLIESLFSFANLFVEFNQPFSQNLTELIREHFLTVIQKEVGSLETFISPIISGLIFSASNRIELLNDDKLEQLLQLLPKNSSVDKDTLKEMLFIYADESSEETKSNSKLKMRDLVLSFKFLLSSPNLKEKDQMLRAVRSIPLPKALTQSQADSLKKTIEHSLNLQSKTYGDSAELYEEMKRIIDARVKKENQSISNSESKKGAESIQNVQRDGLADSLKLPSDIESIWISDSELSGNSGSKTSSPVTIDSATAIKNLLK